MCFRASLRSVSCWRASGEIGCLGAKSAQFNAKPQRCSKVSSSTSRNSSSVQKYASNNSLKKMLSTFEEHVFQTKRRRLQQQQQQARYYSTLINSTNDGSGNNQHGMQHKKTDEEIQLEYEEAINALNSLQPNVDTIRRAVYGGVTQKALNDMPELLEIIGITLEELDKHSYIHVSGTKGKGTTCALTESILRGFGVRTGFFSSPHLISVTERIRINGEPIEKQKFTRALWFVYNRLKEKLKDSDDMPPYFKFLTLVAFHVFIEEKLDVIILEVGCGGELDCTNVLRNTKTVGITSLGLEHTHLLGNTLREIAWQKAGIIKPGSHVYTSVTQPECLQIIKERAVEKNATLHIVPAFSEYFQNSDYKKLLKSLNNVSQINSSLAIQLSHDWLRKHTNGFKRDFAINETKITKTVVNGLINCHWPGRCQRISYMNFNIHLDGAHTIESMNICSAWFAKVTKDSTAPKVLVFNTTGERNSKDFLSILTNNSDFELVCCVPNVAGSSNIRHNDNQSPRDFGEQLMRAKTNAANWNLLVLERNLKGDSYVFESILEAFLFIRNLYGSERQLDVLVTGSLHLIGATILALNDYKKNTNSINLSKVY